MFQSLFSSEFRKNAAKLLSANVISQAIALAVYPVVTRQYSPEEFGDFNIFMAICSVLFIASTGRYEGAIQLPKSNRDAIALFQVCLWIATLFAALLLIIILCFKNLILTTFSIESIGWGIGFIPFLVLLNAIGVAWRSWTNRNKEFGSTGRYLITQNLTNSVAKIFFGFLKITRLGLLFSFTIGYFCSFLYIIRKKSEKKWTADLFRKDYKRMREIAAVYSNYPKYNMPLSVLNTFSSNIPLLLLAPFFEKNMIGFYSLAVTIGIRPITLFNNSMYNVFFQRISETYHKREPIFPLLKKYFLTGISILLPTFVCIYIFSVPIVSQLFGKQWAETATILNILLPWFFATIFVKAFLFLPDIFFKQKKSMILEIVCLILRSLALIYGIYQNDFYIAIIAFSTVSFLTLFYQAGWYYRLVANYERQLVK